MIHRNPFNSDLIKVKANYYPRISEEARQSIMNLEHEEKKFIEDEIDEISEGD